MKKKFYPVVALVTVLCLHSPLFGQTFTLLKDIYPGSNGSSYFNFARVNDVLFFRPDDGAHGDELWKTDGTAEGTVLVKDIYPGSAGSELQLLTNVGGILFFTANDGVHGSELWKSDGTESGTQMIKDINPGSNSSSASSFFSIDGQLYFNATDGTNGRELWKSDGTTAGTLMVKDIFPGVATSGLEAGTPHSGNPQGFALVNSFIYFIGSDDYYKTGIWKTDGTAAGTVLVKDIYPGSNYVLNNLIDVNGNLFFTVYGGTEGNELWKSDGTPGGTVKIKSLFGGNFDNHCVAIGNTLYFLESDGLWKSDGTDAGTIMLKERGNAYFNTVELMTRLDGQVYFTGYDNTHGWELWKTDGTVSGTQLVKDINAGTPNSEINSFARVGNKLMFSATDPIHGNEIWISDGTPAGTKLMQDIEPGAGNALPPQFYEFKNAFIEVNGKIYAGITTTGLGSEVWVANIPSDIGLPLELLEFNAWLENDDGKLQWKTDQETNTARFIVERSLDGQHFEPIGSVDATNTTGTHQYNFTDPGITSLNKKIIYYRLRQLDIDGKFAYSKIVPIEIDPEKGTVVLYPNPVRTTMNLSIYLPQQQRLEWQLLDNSGRLIRHGHYELSRGQNRVAENIGSLSQGVYLLQIRGFNIQKLIKVIKQ